MTTMEVLTAIGVGCAVGTLLTLLIGMIVKLNSRLDGIAARANDTYTKVETEKLLGDNRHQAVKDFVSKDGLASVVELIDLKFGNMGEKLDDVTKSVKDLTAVIIKGNHNQRAMDE